MYVIESGRAQVLLQRFGAKPVSVATIGDGEIFGELALIDGKPRAADVVAVTEVNGYRIDRKEFAEMCARLSPAAYKVLRHMTVSLCGRLRNVNTTTFGRPTTWGKPTSAEARSFWQNVVSFVKRE
jgi:CRP-like cAMP-binding protein